MQQVTITRILQKSNPQATQNRQWLNIPIIQKVTKNAKPFSLLPQQSLTTLLSEVFADSNVNAICKDHGAGLTYNEWRLFPCNNASPLANQIPTPMFVSCTQLIQLKSINVTCRATAKQMQNINYVIQKNEKQRHHKYIELTCLSGKTLTCESVYSIYTNTTIQTGVTSAVIYVYLTERTGISMITYTTTNSLK